MSRCWYCDEELITANYCEDHMGICNKCYDTMFRFGDVVVHELQNKIKVLEKALQLARKYMFNVMCSEDVPSEEWFIKCAKEMMKSE